MRNRHPPPHMNKRRFTVRRSALQARHLSKLLILLTAGAALSLPAFAAQVLAKFDVQITIRTAAARPETGSCESTATAGRSTSTIVCTASPVSDILLTGPSGRKIIAQSPVSLPTTAQPTAAEPAPVTPTAPSAALPPVSRSPAIPGGYRFMSNVSGHAGTIDIYTGSGMVTAFKLVTWAEREYIEMTVTW